MADEDRHLRWRVAGRPEKGDLLQRWRERHGDPGGGEQPRCPRAGTHDGLARRQRGAVAGAQRDLPAVVLDGGDADACPDRGARGAERPQHLLAGNVLDLAPEFPGLPGHRDVAAVVIAEPEDAAAAVRASALVPDLSLLKDDHVTAPAR